ncbi:hypothetical protein [Bdellovibrio reynosensis]|uniref:Uncharacterized protein n=1 Tax=Bdellovibrio reynosensis TaxID=2835041 RepID=A0ABY4C7W7_9BACT|nr:hypothetical protein [Bdellovibrio reynosensis]UOF00819.1 hypothetical protein MNR06_14050 [Bdellovibrio reynosensis]
MTLKKHCEELGKQIKEMTEKSIEASVRSFHYSQKAKRLAQSASLFN